MTPVAPSAPAELDQHYEYRLLADSIPNLAWIAHADGAIYWYNRRWFEYTGKTLAEMEGWGWQSVHDAKELPRVLARWRASIRSGEAFEMTFPLLGADGVFRPFLTRVVPLRDSEGTVTRWFGTNTDVEVELRAAVALRESEQRFRIATEAVSSVIWTNTPEGEMRGEQNGWSAFTGQTPEQYNGYGWAAVIHPEDVQPTIDAWQISVRENQPFAFEHRVLRRDGVYRLCSVRALPVRNEDGSVREWIGVHTDITEDRQRQQALRDTISALRRQEEMIEAAQITNNVGFWRYQPSDGGVFFSSGTRHLLGLPLEGNPLLHDALRRVHPDDAPRIEAAMADALRTGHYGQEFRAATAVPGEYRWILGAARVVHADGEEPHLVGINFDITQQKRSADALIQTEKLAAVGRLASSIAHEINNPLEAVTNLLYLLLQTPIDEEQRSYCTTMTSELQRISAIATHTLRFHRQSTSAANTSVKGLMESVLALFEGKLRSARVALDCRLPEAHKVHGYDGELRQVLANLVGNAIDAMNAVPEASRRLILRTHALRSFRHGVPGIAITVADTGCGIAPSVVRRIFDPFFTTKGDVGTGLGLWISSEIVHKHGGHIQIRSSQGRGSHGTVFRVFLPRQAPTAARTVFT